MSITIKRYIKDILIRSYLKSKGKFSRINLSPLFVFGNQKSGTSAISALLAKATGKSLTLDLWPIYQLGVEFKALRNNTLSIEEFIKNHKYEFSRDIIKEPNLLYFYSNLKEFFDLKRSIYIVRDPRDNIRSILNRLDIKGNGKTVNNFNKLSVLWKIILGNDFISPNGKDYIIKLANRWNDCSEIYFKNKEDFILFKYEDFKKDKVNSIKELIEKMGLEYCSDISNDVNIQYQIKGDNSKKWEDFFGSENLEIINQTCSVYKSMFAYN